MNEDNIRTFAGEISDYIAIYTKAKQAAETTDYKKIEELMLCEKYSYISKEKKEATILRAALEPVQLQKLKGDLNQSELDFLYYLVFEYQIGEDIYSKMDYDYKSQMVEDMFAKRKINSELLNELGNSDNSNKRQKV